MKQADIPGRGDSGCQGPEEGASQADSEPARRGCGCRGETRRECLHMQREVGATEGSDRGQKGLTHL